MITVRAMRWLTLTAAATLVMACGDDGTTTSSSAGGGGAGGSTTTAGAGGVGGTGGGGDATGGGGMGGSGGTPFVDPIAGIDAVTLVSSGHSFTEGPVWFASQSLLYFSDIPAQLIYQLDLNDDATVWKNNSGRANGHGVDVGGDMISCEGGNRRVVRHTDSGDPSAFEVVASDYNGDALNAPNDTIVRSDGTVYFTDPNYGLPAPQQELAFQGVFAVKAGVVTLIDDTMDKPNGIALSPDEATLYVTDAAMAELWAFDVNGDGSVVAGSKNKLADTNGSPDGFGVDDQGYLYLSTAAGVDVYDPQGNLFGNIPVPKQPANCTFGGADRRTLYITAREDVYKVTLNVPGLP